MWLWALDLAVGVSDARACRAVLVRFLAEGAGQRQPLDRCALDRVWRIGADLRWADAGCADALGGHTAAAGAADPVVAAPAAGVGAVCGRLSLGPIQSPQLTMDGAHRPWRSAVASRCNPRRLIPRISLAMPAP